MQHEDPGKIILLQEGNHTAFNEVYYAFHKKAFHFFLKNIRSADLAKELTQETFIRFWQYRRSLSTNFSIEKQVFIVAKGLLINHLKKEAGLRKKKTAYEQHTSIQPMATNGYAATFETSHQLSLAILQLPPMRKKIIRLKLVEGYSNKEIANELSLSDKTVEDHITKAYRKFKQLNISLFLVLLFLVQR